MSDVIVIGSINMDLVVQTPRVPEGGETISGNDFKMIPGGKGANQAVAASRSGASTAFIGCTGDDPFGKVLLNSLHDNGVDIRHTRVDSVQPTGTATIIVEKNGQNRIIIVPGANGTLEAQDIDSLRPVLEKARIVLLQFEIPLKTVFHCIHVARETGCTVICNPAPAYAIPDEIFQQIDIIILNENEIGFLSNMDVRTIDEAISAGKMILDKGLKTVIVTLGSKGAVLVTQAEQKHFAAIDVAAVDTTAAGDSFVGAFAAALLDRVDIHQAVRYAIAAGSLAVTKLGAQPSIPTKNEITALISRSGKE